MRNLEKEKENIVRNKETVNRQIGRSKGEKELKKIADQYSIDFEQLKAHAQVGRRVRSESCHDGNPLPKLKRREDPS